MPDGANIRGINKWVCAARGWVERHQRTLRRIGLWISIPALVAGIAVSILMHPNALFGLDWRYLAVVALLGVPAMTALNALEYVLTARLLGQRIGPAYALDITVMGTAANMLPLPGGPLIRVAGLTAAGASLTHSVATSVLVLLVSVGVAAIYSGLWIGTIADLWIGGLVVVAGCIFMLASVAAARRAPGGIGVLAVIAVTRSGLVLVTAGRLFLCFGALGISASFAQSSGLAVSGVASSVIPFVPAGIGVREWLAAALSPIVGLSMGAGFLVTFLNRLTTMAVVVPIALVLNLRHGKVAPRATTS